MPLDKAAVAHIATLARIRLSESELELLADELSHILTWVEQLNAPRRRACRCARMP